MKNNSTKKNNEIFSIYATRKPRFNARQIHIESPKYTVKVTLPKQTRKLVVGRSGKIEYTE